MPPLSLQDGVEVTLNTTFEHESVSNAKVLVSSEENREPESEIVRFFAGDYLLQINRPVLGCVVTISRNQ